MKALTTLIAGILFVCNIYSQEPYVRVSNFTGSLEPSEWIAWGDDTGVSHSNQTLEMEVTINSTLSGGGGELPGDVVILDMSWIVPRDGEICFSFDWNDGGGMFPNISCLSTVYCVDGTCLNLPESEDLRFLSVEAGQVLSFQVIQDTGMENCSVVGTLVIDNFRYYYPDSCPTDLNKDGDTDTNDLLSFLSQFGQYCED